MGFKLRIAEGMALPAAVLAEALRLPEGGTDQVVGGVYTLSFRAWELCHPRRRWRSHEAARRASPPHPVASLTTGLRAWLSGFASLEQS